MKNVELAEMLIAELVKQGVRDFTVCAGARNAPLVKVLGAFASSKKLQIRYFFEERSAAFFALGRARRDARPTCVVTTSGTAVAELFPAAVEAYYSSVPLVLLTADRPASYRGTGAPQTIDQMNIFGQYSGTTVAWDTSSQMKVKLHTDYATHVNVCFEEPLLDAPIQVSEKDLEAWLAESLWKRPDLSESQGWDKPAMYSADAVSKLSQQFQRPLFIVSELTPEGASLVSDVIGKLDAPVYYEACSQLRSRAFPNALSAFDRTYSTDFFRNNFNGMIRIGGVPTHRVWRDLDLQLQDTPVLSFSEREFGGLGRSTPVLPLKNLSSILQLSHPKFGELLSADKAAWEKVSQCLTAFPESEAAYVRRLSEQVPEGSLVFLSNSLPIREWDHFANDLGKSFEVAVMRGVNGIDGVVSHFLGRATPDRENWLILGDLTALYDMAGLALRSAAAAGPLRLVIINNRGGKIFSSMFEDRNFENTHSFQFGALADMFGWDYLQEFGEDPKPLKSQHALVELRPNDEQSQKFQKAYRE